MLRVAFTSFVSLSAAALTLISGLAIWTHLPLRDLVGPKTVVFLSSFVALGLPAFAVASWISLRVLPTARSLSRHFAAAGILYVAAAAIFLRIVAFPVPQQLEGGDIALRVALFVSLLEIVVITLIHRVWGGRR